MPIEPKSMAYHNIRNTFNSSSFLDTLISDPIIQSFSTNHSEHSYFNCIQSADIFDSNSPAFWIGLYESSKYFGLIQV